MTIPADLWGIPATNFWLRGHRKDRVVEYDETLGTWNVYGYPENVAALNDPATFSSDLNDLIPGADRSLADGDLTQMDPPTHRKLRVLASRAFTPRVVAELEPKIAELTNELLDAVGDRDEFDLIAELAYPLPVTVISELLGVPREDQAMFKSWVDDIIFKPDLDWISDDADGQQMAAESRTLAPVLRYLGEHAAERRKRPRQDLLTALVEAEVDGERLSDNQVVNLAFLLLSAGHFTTTMLLGNAVLCLDLHPRVAATIRLDRSTVPGLVEETLRYFPPVSINYRRTTAEVEIGGQLVPADQKVLLFHGAANRDPRQFEAPDTFDPTRGPNPHLGFGRGIHVCLGAPLARLESRIALDLLFHRYAVLRTDADDPPVFVDSPEFTGASRLPLRTS